LQKPFTEALLDKYLEVSGYGESSRFKMEEMRLRLLAVVQEKHLS
jgi:hypothetical protein